MNLTWILLSLLVLTSAIPEDQVKTFIRLTKYDYEDYCLDFAQSEWNFVNEPSNETLHQWEKSVTEYARQKVEQKNSAAKKNETFSDSSLQYAYGVIVKPGDALLDPQNFQKLVSFSGEAELSRLTGHYSTGNEKKFRHDVERDLARSGSPEEKLSSWSSWHKTLSPMAINFTEILPLIEKAARANEKNDTREYWEMLSGYEKGYEHAKMEWNKISQVYNKVLKFVKKRLSQKYGDRIENNTLPTHILGSLGGYDWTNLAMDVVPYNEVAYEIRKNLWEKKIVGETLYKEASGLGQILLKHVPQADFWKDSNFRGQCPARLTNFCKYGKMRVSTCYEASIANFISAHKNVAKILATQMSSENEPILNMANRYSALEEGMAELFGILSMSGAWLKARGLISNTTDSEQIQIDSLMITALEVLPRIAYYLAADMWRINATKNHSLNENNLTSNWWKYRMEYQSINTSMSDLPTFLDDDYITSNKPYLSKFLGTILAFQIYEFVMESTEFRYETILSRPRNHFLTEVIRRGYADHWPSAIEKYLDISEINADYLVSYFLPLMDYIDEEDESSEAFTIPEKEEKDLDEIADKYRKILSESTTSTTTMATKVHSTTPATMVKSKSLEQPPQMDNVKKEKKMEASKSWLAEASTKHSASTKATNAEQANGGIEIPSETESIKMDGDENDEERVNKPNTSKAVWAVGAVLAATIAICIIAIFGRRRCRKAPKNRRYV